MENRKNRKWVAEEYRHRMEGKVRNVLEWREGNGPCRCYK